MYKRQIEERYVSPPADEHRRRLASLREELRADLAAASGGPVDRAVQTGVRDGGRSGVGGGVRGEARPELARRQVALEAAARAESSRAVGRLARHRAMATTTLVQRMPPPAAPLVLDDELELELAVQGVATMSRAIYGDRARRAVRERRGLADNAHAVPVPVRRQLGLPQLWRLPRLTPHPSS